MKDFFKGQNPAAMGLYIGVILGAVVMMIAGGLGFQGLADMSLILGLCAGPALGWIIGKLQEKNDSRKPADSENSDSVK